MLTQFKILYIWKGLGRQGDLLGGGEGKTSPKDFTVFFFRAIYDFLFQKYILH